MGGSLADILFIFCLFTSHSSLVDRNVEFHPMLFRQHEACPYKEFPTLSKVIIHV